MKNNYSKSFYIFWLILLLPSIFTAQDKPAGLHWTTLESVRKDLTFAIPSDFLVDSEEKERHIFAYQNKVRIDITVNETNFAQDRLKSIRSFPAEANTVISHFKINNFAGDIYKSEKEKNVSLSIYAASSKVLYIIFVSSENPDNSVLKNFIHSIKFNDKPLFVEETQLVEVEGPKISIESLKTSPVILEVLKNKDSKKDKKPQKREVKYELADNKTFKDEKNYSRPLMILRKEQPRYTDAARNFNVSGDVKLKVLFRSDGQIGEITVTSKLDKGLDKSAVEAASKIKFLPAEVEGKAVDVFKEITYTFTIY